MQIAVDEILGSPSWVASTKGFLSGPADEEPVAKVAQVLPKADVADPKLPIRRFLDEHKALFGHGAEVMTSATIQREFVTPHNGMRTVIWQQELDGIPVFESLLVGHITVRGELVSLSSRFVPDVATASLMVSSRRAAIESKPPISPQQAIVNAASNIGETLRVEDVSIVSATPEGPQKRQSSAAKIFLGDVDVRLVWLPMNRTTLRLCWAVHFIAKSRSEAFLILVDAQSAEALLRYCLTDYQSQQSSFRVFTSDSPSPMSPGHQVPSSAQPPLLGPTPNHGRQLVTISPSVASPNGWINDGNQETVGNNVDSHLDFDGDDIPDVPRPSGGAQRVFDFALDLGQAPTTEQAGAYNQSAAVVNLFYWCNWMHDRLYELGFNEAAGNFQTDNFGRGGIGGDAVQADAQDGSGINNANFYTPIYGDGPNPLPPRMQMFLCNGPNPDRDGDVDAEVILHEYAHGLSNRRVGGGPRLTALQSRGLGEGWSDFYALALLSEANDDVHAKYPFSGYFSYNFDSAGFYQNYYFGIRRYPYTTDMGQNGNQYFNPLTFRDIDPNAVPARPSANPNVPPRSWLFGNTATEVHNMGEVWCVALWDARANLIERYGFATGNELILRLVTDGMNLTPANPNYIQARDAILLADRVNTGGANLHELWAAFARRGMGWGATSPASSTTSGIVEDFTLPPQGTELWNYQTGNGYYGVYSSPAIGPDGAIYIGSGDGKLYALNPNGQLRWSFTEDPISAAFHSTPIVGPDGTIYARRSDSYLYAINPDGTKKWKSLIYYDSWVSPALSSDGTIYVAGTTELWAIRPSDGAILWSFATDNTIYSSPAIALDGTIYFGGMANKIYAVDPVTHLSKAGWPVTTGGSVVSSPVIARDGTIYVGCYDGKLYALKPDGTPKWTPVILGSGEIIDSSPSIGPDGTVYVGSLDDKVYAVNPDNGQIRPGWPYTTGYNVRSSPAIAADGTVYIGSYDCKVHAIRPDGTSLGAPWPFNTGNLVFSSPAIGADGTVYVGSVNGKVFALSGVSALAHSDWPMFRQNSRRTGYPPTLSLENGERLQDNTFRFTVRGLSGMICQVEGSDSLFSWNPLPNPRNPQLITLPSSGLASFTDDQADGYPYRFYRVRSGAVLSHNSLGFVVINAPSGQSMIANPLDNPVNNTIGTVLTSLPDLTTIYKWNESTQTYLSANYSSGSWDNPGITLNPGEGVLVQLPAAATFSFVGNLRQGTLANPISAGWCIRSSMVPQAGAMDATLGFQPANGDQIYRWNTQTPGYDIYTYFSSTGWSPTAPELRVGESFWISTSTSRVWNRIFNVW